MELTATAEKIVTIFEFETDDYNLEDYFFYRWDCGYFQVWMLDGLVYDILTRDEARHMYE